MIGDWRVRTRVNDADNTGETRLNNPTHEGRVKTDSCSMFE